MPRIVGGVAGAIAALMVVAVALLVAGNGHAQSDSVNVSLTEWAVTPDVPSVPEGAVTFTVTNDGTLPHELLIIRTDLPPDELPLTTEGDRVDEAQVDVIGEVEALAPGFTASGTFSVVAGNYVLICNLPLHYAAGMYTAFTVASESEPGLATLTSLQVFVAESTALDVPFVALSPDFEPDIPEYSVDVAGAVLSVGVASATDDPTASVTVNGVETPQFGGLRLSQPIALQRALTAIAIVVSAADDSATLTYTVTVERAPFHEFSGRDATGSGARIDGTPVPPGRLIKAINEVGQPVGSTLIDQGEWLIAVEPALAAEVRFVLEGASQFSAPLAVVGGQTTELALDLASGPALPPHEFFGDASAGSGATIDGSPAPDGTLVKAINERGYPVGSALIDEGRWRIPVDYTRAGHVRFTLSNARGRTSAIAPEPDGNTPVTVSLFGQSGGAPPQPPHQLFGASPGSAPVFDGEVAPDGMVVQAFNEFDQFLGSTTVQDALWLLQIEPTAASRVRLSLGGSGERSDPITIISGALTEVPLDLISLDVDGSPVVATPRAVMANGVTAATIAVTLRNGEGEPIPGHAVSLTARAPGSLISAPSGLSDADGLVTFSVTSSTVGSVAYVATDDTLGAPLTQTAAVAFASFIVDSTADDGDAAVGDGVCLTAAGTCTLRGAIEEANAAADLDLIAFAIRRTDPDYTPATSSFRIQPVGALPHLVAPVILDGTTQPEFATVPHPVIELHGNPPPGDVSSGIRIDAGASGSTVRGLVINGFAEAGISVFQSDGNTIGGSFLGTDVTGTSAIPNGRSGIILGGRTPEDNTIGGPGPGDRNVISGNVEQGILIAGAGHNLIEGNVIGLDATSSFPLGNGSGIELIGPMVGDVIRGNTIAGNVDGGINGYPIILNGVPGWPSETRIVGNLVGTNAFGQAGLGNGSGIQFLLGSQIQIGGPVANAGRCEGPCNVIAGNRSAGVFVSTVIAGPTGEPIRSSGFRIEGNLIGLAPDGLADLGNLGPGLVLRDVVDALIDENIVGANEYGIRLERPETRGTIVQRNILGGNGLAALGTAPDFLAQAPNRLAGVEVTAGAHDNLIGGSLEDEANIVVFNGGAGVEIASPSVGNQILGNRIRDNGGGPIVLIGCGPNDDLDADTGANRCQNSPVIQSAGANATTTTVTGTLQSSPNTAFRIEVFGESTGWGRGGAQVVTTNAAGDAAWSVTLPEALLVGSLVRATATDLTTGDTSAFSPNLAVEAAPGPPPAGGGGGFIPPPPPDADADGLSDAEEARIGTDPAVSDTDGDGLDDGTEVNETGTDPLNADTDGDFSPDGMEVANRSDPLDPTDPLLQDVSDATVFRPALVDGSVLIDVALVPQELLGVPTPDGTEILVPREALVGRGLVELHLVVPGLPAEAPPLPGLTDLPFVYVAEASELIPTQLRTAQAFGDRLVAPLVVGQPLDLFFTRRVDVGQLAVLVLAAGSTGWERNPFEAAEDGHLQVTPVQDGVVILTELPLVRQVVGPGWNAYVYLGTDPVLVETLADTFAGRLESVWRYDAASQQFESFRPAGPAVANTLEEVRPRDALLIFLRDGPDVTLETPTLLPVARSLATGAGWTLFAFTGADGTSPSDLFSAPAVQSAWLFDAAMGAWLGYFPGQPAALNGFASLPANGLLFVRTVQPAVVTFQEVVRPSG